MEPGQGRRNEPQFIFEDFPDPMVHGTRTGQTSINFGNSSHPGNSNDLPNDTVGMGAMDDLQGLSEKTEATPTSTAASPSFWTVDYYQKFFNVNTDDVLERIKRSMVPRGGENYLMSHIRPNPDLYGPFWICITLVFSIAISGNMANYLQTANTRKYHWKYDFHVVSYAATCIFLYAWLLPVGLWAAIRWTTKDRDTEDELIEPHASPGLLEIVCLYGYSLAIYIPVVFFCTVQITWLQWTLVGIATFLSGGVLLRSLLPVISGKHRIVYIAVIFGMHLILAVGFMQYFFHAPASSPVPSVGDHTLSTKDLPKANFLFTSTRPVD